MLISASIVDIKPTIEYNKDQNNYGKNHHTMT